MATLDAMPSTIALSYAIALESIRAVWDEVFPLAMAHNSEVGAFPELAFDPDRQAFEVWDKAGLLRLFTVRNSVGFLIGYAAFLLTPSMFHRTVNTAHHLALYVHPDHRRNGVATDLLRRADEFLESEAVQLVFQHTKDGARDHGVMLRRLGYQLVDHIYVRRLAL